MYFQNDDRIDRFHYRLQLNLSNSNFEGMTVSIGIDLRNFQNKGIQFNKIRRGT